MRSIEMLPITPADTGRVALFLHENMRTDIPAARWSEAVSPPWSEEPNGGYMLVEEEKVVGVYLACYSEREFDGRRVRMCNLGTWCVLDEHRFHSLRLLKTLLGQQGFHFTDLTPNQQVAQLNRRLGFRQLSASTQLVPNLPWPGRARGRVSSKPAVIESALSGTELGLYRDHRDAGAVVHVVLQRDGASCYVALHRERRKGLTVLRVLHVSDQALFRAMARPLARHLLVHYRAVAHVVEEQIVDRRPLISVTRHRTPRMYKSDTLNPARIDYLYSELACLSE